MQTAHAPLLVGSTHAEKRSTDAAASIQATARTAGFLYLLLIPLGIFGMLYIPHTLFVEGDTAATVRHIVANEALFRASILTALVTQVVQVFVVFFLYQVLEPAGRGAALLMVVFILLGVPIAMLNELNHIAVWALLDGDVELVTLFLRLHHAGIVIAQIFWGLWLAPMGCLVFRSGFLPRVIGGLLVVAGCGYVTDSVLFFLAPGFGVTFSEFTFLGELLITFWLLIRGVDVEAWETAAAPAH